MLTLTEATNKILVRKAFNRATDQLAELPMPEWPQWLQYTLAAMEHEAEKIEATADEVREFLEAVRGALDDRLESGKWQAI